MNTLPPELQPPTRGEKIAESLRSAGHKAAAVPLPFTGIIGAFLTMVAAAVDSLDGFVNKSFSDGVRKGVSGAVDATATGLFSRGWESLALVPVNWIVTLANPNMDTIPELLRKGTDSELKNVLPENRGFPQMNPNLMAAARQNAMFGMAPPVATAQAGVAFAPEIQQQLDTTLPSNPAPGMPPEYWSDRAAASKGYDPKQMNDAYKKQNKDEVRALQAAAKEQATLGAS